MTKTQRQAIRWLVTGEVGLSSQCMMMWLAFGERVSDPWAPADPADLDRCLRMLAAVPGLRRKLPLMAEVSPKWAALIARWAEVEASHLDEVGLGWTKAGRAPRTYALMESILRPQADAVTP